MKIAIDSGPLSSGDSVRGIGVYTRELIKSLNVSGVDFSKVNLEKYDLVHFTSFNPFKICIPFAKPKGVKYVLTIYDLIPLIYPDHYPSGVIGGFNWLINKYLIRKNIDAIITISETSKKDICRFLGVDPSKVYVVYLAPRSIFRKIRDSKNKREIARKYNLPKNFALYVGDVNYNKNIPVLLRACNLAKIKLVISGKQAKELKDAKDLSHRELSHLNNLDWSNVNCLGYVPDEDLVVVYNLASVYIQPSLYEGFGLPLVEAVKCETPVVATKTQCLVEVLGEKFDYVDPLDPEDMARGILNPNKVKTLPREYSWDKVGRDTYKIYEKILERV